MHVITAPEPFYPKAHSDKHSVYLAGAIDMGTAINWQAVVIEELSAHRGYLILNPRRAKAFTPEMQDAQILWELDALEKADTILMWFPADSKAPVAMFESGLYWRSGKLVIGAEPGFYRRRNLELTAQWYGLTLVDTLPELLRQAKARRRFGKLESVSMGFPRGDVRRLVLETMDSVLDATHESR